MRNRWRNLVALSSVVRVDSELYEEAESVWRYDEQDVGYSSTEATNPELAFKRIVKSLPEREFVAAIGILIE